MKKVICLLALLLAACGSSTGATPPPPPPCDQKCQDETAMRAMREIVKLAYNVTLQGKPVGDHDETVPCPQGGSVRVVGNATSNSVQGATFVNLTYTFTQCTYLQRDTDPKQNYRIAMTGDLAEQGTLAVQPSSTTAIDLQSHSLDLEGTVYDPPIDYSAKACPLVVGQDGNKVSGTLCDREVGLTL